MDQQLKEDLEQIAGQLLVERATPALSKVSKGPMPEPSELGCQDLNTAMKDPSVICRCLEFLVHVLQF